MLWSLPGNKPSPRWFDPFHQFVSLSSIIITVTSNINISDVIYDNKHQEYFAMKSQFLSASYHCQTLQTLISLESEALNLCILQFHQWLSITTRTINDMAYVPISPALKVSSLSSAASKSYKALALFSSCITKRFDMDYLLV